MPILTWMAKRLYAQVRHKILLCMKILSSFDFHFSTGGEARTPDTWFWRPVLYQLSYTRKCRSAVADRQDLLVEDFSDLT